MFLFGRFFAVIERLEIQRTERELIEKERRMDALYGQSYLENRLLLLLLLLLLLSVGSRYANEQLFGASYFGRKIFVFACRMATEIRSQKTHLYKQSRVPFY